MGIDHVAVWVLGMGLGWILCDIFKELGDRLQKVTWNGKVIWERKSDGS